MSAQAVVIPGQKRFLKRAENKNLRSVTLDRTPENMKLVREYEDLARRINEIPSRMAGLHMNFRRRDIPMQAARLAAERDELMKKLLDMEKILFPKQKNADAVSKVQEAD